MTPPRRGPGRPKGTRRDPAVRRAELVDAAAAAIRAVGPDVSMEQIAAAAGVSKATLYDNFPGKSGLTDELLERFGTTLLGRFAKGLGGPVQPVDFVRGGIEVFVSAIDRDPEIYRFILATNGPRALLDEAGPPVAAIAAMMLRAADADVAAADTLAAAILGGIFAAADQWASARTMPRKAFVRQLTDFVWSGLAAFGIDALDEPLDLADLASTLSDALRPQPA